MWKLKEKGERQYIFTNQYKLQMSYRILNSYCNVHIGCAEETQPICDTHTYYMTHILKAVLNEVMVS